MPHTDDHKTFKSLFEGAMKKNKRRNDDPEAAAKKQKKKKKKPKPKY